MSRPRDWSPLHLYSDPVPGDPHQVSAYASHYSDVADAIRSAATKLTTIANHSDGEASEYVDAFKEAAHDVAAKVSRAHQRYARVADAMRDYASPLETAQREADAALTRARNASDSNSSATTMHHHYEQELQRPDLSDEDRTRYTLLQHQNQGDLADAQREIAAAKADLQHAIELR
ncbi:MAG: putative T7SS-secreted protein, partial [Lacisediminihabitans sp.]